VGTFKTVLALATTAVVAAITALALAGCTPKTYSLVTPGKRVDLVQLETEEAAETQRLNEAVNHDQEEITEFNKRDAAARQDLQSQATRNDTLISAVSGVVQVAAGQPFNIATALGAAYQLIGTVALAFHVRNAFAQTAQATSSASATQAPATETPQKG